MCPPESERELQRQAERAKLSSLTLQDLVTEMRRMYKRATWESPEDFSDQPNHPHVKLDWFIAELEKRFVMEAPEGIFFIYKGWKFTPPFHCMYCGIVVDHKQWAFSRSCGGCDVSNSHTAKLRFFQWTAGPHEVHDRTDSHFLPEEQFVPLEEVLKKSPINPAKQPFKFPPDDVPSDGGSGGIIQGWK